MRGRVVVVLACALVVAGCVRFDGGTQGDGNAGESADVGDGKAVQPGRAPKGSQAHVHDDWYGAHSVMLLDETVGVMVFHNHQFDEPPRQQHTHGCDETLASTSQGGSRKFALPPGNIVLPGTGALEFIFDWTEPSISGLRFLYRPANGHDFIDAGRVRPGETLRVPLLPEMVDAGHTARSKWAFFLCAESDAPLDVAEGDVRVTVFAIRAPTLPVEPAHPDAWANNTSIVLSSRTYDVATRSAGNQGEDVWLAIGLESGATVAPGTERVTVLVEATDASAAQELGPENLLLYWRDSSVPDWVYRQSEGTTDAATDVVFQLDVDADMADGMYATTSNWDLWLRLTSAVRAQTEAGMMSAPFVYDGTLAVTVVAQRNATHAVPP